MRSDNIFFNSVSFVCACLIPLLVVGPFWPDLIISILSLLFVFYCIIKKNYKIFLNYYFFFFTLFWFVCVLSSLISDNVFFSIKSSLPYIRIGIFALLISFLVQNNNKILSYFYFSFFLTYILLIIDGYFQYFNKTNLLGFGLGSHDRISSFFGEELILGSYLVRLSPLFIGLFIIRENRKKFENYLFSLVLILTSYLVFISGERASMLFLFISSSFLLIFLSKYKKESCIIFLISFFMITLTILNDSKFYERYVTNPIEGMKVLESKKPKIIFFSNAHDSLIRTAWNMFLDKPILGQGPKMFRIKCKDPKIATGTFPCNTHPHNFYVQLLAETGIIGFSFLAGLFIFFLYLLLKHAKKYFFDKLIWLSDFKICLLAGLLITIWPITTNGNIFTNHLIIMYSMQIGFFVKN